MSSTFISSHATTQVLLSSLTDSLMRPHLSSKIKHVHVHAPPFGIHRCYIKMYMHLVPVGLQLGLQMICITSHTGTLTCWNSKERRLFNCSSRLVQAFLPEASTTIHRHCRQEWGKFTLSYLSLSQKLKSEQAHACVAIEQTT